MNSPQDELLYRDLTREDDVGLVLRGLLHIEYQLIEIANAVLPFGERCAWGKFPYQVKVEFAFACGLPREVRSVLLKLGNARDQGKDMVAASDFVRSDFQSLGLSTSDKRIDNLVLALIPGNAAFAFERKDLKPVTIRYAAAGICAIQVAGDRNPSHVVALVDSAAKCQNMLKPELRENVLASCVAAEISNLESGK